MTTTNDLNFLEIQNQSDNLQSEFERIAKELFENYIIIDYHGNN